MKFLSLIIIFFILDSQNSISTEYLFLSALITIFPAHHFLECTIIGESSCMSHILLSTRNLHSCIQPLAHQLVFRQFCLLECLYTSRDTKPEDILFFLLSWRVRYTLDKMYGHKDEISSVWSWVACIEGSWDTWSNLRRWTWNYHFCFC